ncbi:hypothetical protein [Apilactobacillus timberlakei]|uniref:Uncharacterized protein n=1 Tax=Apilactobacillus timberlakei TaxID=2008380 RepID=A0ABY2YRT2_9LACO|nr:hypothetical protein [Apilactobacillus timberlakei]TPR12360.1 hypothetical protein DYZ97_06835 [Apilactobacillus timberlakei]TPR12869.1 hypothetical protein DY048_06750 [Apilactobacillus timberlakei]TPR14419.1 hypothetical protein DY052_07255 [Apilactobacillus timberlakei]TPR17635.1 hypothetical protein DY138_06945 [Apilactobacillus timberlakei]TPR19349.1 hypothetical protein DYZ95_01660 [Apilactobacillus timberlakei]
MKLFNKKAVYAFVTIIALSTVTSWVSTNASQKNNNQSAKQEYSAKTITKNSKWANRLSKNGYVFRIKNSQMDYYDGEFTRNLSHKKPSNYNIKDVKKFANSNMNFKVNHIWSYKNGLEVNVISQSGKISGWINYNDVYNKERNNKELRKLVQLENNICDKAEDVTFYQYEGKKLHAKKINQIKASINTDLKAAIKLTNKLSDHNQILAQQSIKEIKVFINNSDVKNMPTLLVGRM